MRCVIQPDTPYYGYVASSEGPEQLFDCRDLVRHVGRAGAIVDIVSTDHSGFQASVSSSVAQVKSGMRHDGFSKHNEIVSADEANETFPSDLHFFICLLWLSNGDDPQTKSEYEEITGL